MAEEIDIEKCNFRNFRSSVISTLTLDRVKVILVYISSLVASYDIWPGNEEGLFLFRRFINLSLTHLVRHLPLTYSPGTHMGCHGHEVRSANKHSAWPLQASGTS